MGFNWVFKGLIILSCHLVSYICRNAGLLLIYSSVLSQQCHYHKSLWIAGSHFFSTRKQAMFSVYRKIYYFFTQKCFNALPFWSAEEVPVRSLIGWSALCPLLLCLFLNSSSAIACRREKIVNNSTPPRTKIDFH